MSAQKNRTPCFVAGCITVALIFAVAVAMLGVLFLHVPSAADVYRRTQGQDKLRSVYVDAELDLSALSTQSRNIYQVLQADYQSTHADEEGEAGTSFPCTGIVEYYSNGIQAGEKGYVYGMLVYTDSISTAYDVFTTYYKIAGDQGVDFSETDYFLFVRGSAVFVGNLRAFNKAYMSNLI